MINHIIGSTDSLIKYLQPSFLVYSNQCKCCNVRKILWMCSECVFVQMNVLINNGGGGGGGGGSDGDDNDHDTTLFFYSTYPN